MANITAVSTKSPDLPPPQTPAQRRGLASLMSGATTDGGVMVLLPGKEIRPEDRRGMEARLSTLRQCLDGFLHHNNFASRCLCLQSSGVVHA